MAIAYVRDTGKIRTTGTTQTSAVSFAATPSAGNFIGLGGCCWYSGQNNGTVAVSDNQSNSYSSAIQLEDGSGGDAVTFIQYATATTASGTFTITVDASGTSNTYYTWCAAEYSGITITTPLDKTASAAEGSGDTTITTSTTAALAQADELVLTSLGSSTSSVHTNVLADGSYTTLAGEGDSASYQFGGFGYKIVSSTTGVSANWTWTTNTNNGQCAAVATFKGGTAGPTISAHPSSVDKFTSETANFSVTASGTGTLTYQWKVSTDGTTYNNVSTGSGGTTSSYTTATLGYSDTMDFYKCNVTDDNGNTDSNPALLLVRGAASGAWLRF